MVSLENILSKVSLENILSSPTWNAWVAIGTIFLASVTYLTLRELKRERKVKVNRRIKNKIYERYLEELRHIKDSVAVLTLPTPTPSPDGVQADIPWLSPWGTTEEKHPFLARKVKRKIKKDIEKLAEHCEKFKSFAMTAKDSLFQIYREEETKEIPELRNLEWIRFNSRLGYKYSISLLELIFLDKTFDQWWSDKVKDNPYLSREKPDGKFQTETTKLDKQTFEKIYNAIKQKIDDSPDLTKFVEENKKIHEEAKSLEKSIRKIRDKLVLA